MFDNSKIVGALMQEVEDSKRKEGSRLYIRIKVQSGNREHTHHCLHESNCKSSVFAVMWYASHFWGHGVLDKEEGHWWFDDEIIVEVETYKVLSKTDYELMHNLMYQ